MFRLTIKNLLSRKLRLVTTATAVLLGVAFVVGSLGLAATLNKVFDDVFDGVYAKTDVSVLGAENKVFGFDTGDRQPIPYDTLAEVQAVDGVSFASGSVSFNAQVVDVNGKPVGGNGPPAVGQSWSSDEVNPFTLSEGRAPTGSGEIVADLATVNKADLKLGQEVTIITPTAPIKATLVGVAKFGDLESAGGSNRIFFSADRAREIAGAEAGYNEIFAVANNGVTPEQLRDRVSQALPSDLLVQTGRQAAEEQAATLKQVLSFISFIPLIFGIISLLVSAFIINNTFSILLAQRSSEMALLRAIGARRRQVLTSVVLEAVLIGVISSVLGILIGSGVAYGLMKLLKAFVADFPSTGLVIDTHMIIVGFAAGIGITLLAALLPAIRSSRIPPLAALREVSVDRSAASKKRIILGFILLIVGIAVLVAGLFIEEDKIKIVGGGAAVILLAVYALGPVYAKPFSAVLGWPAAKLRGIPGLLARDNSMRSPQRTASTASALLIGVTLVTFCVVFSASLRATTDKLISDSIAGDFVISNTSAFSGGTINGDVVTRLSELPGLSAVAAIGTTPAKIGAFENPAVTTLNPDTVEKLIPVTFVSGSFEKITVNSIAVSQSEAERNGWSEGENVDVQFASGNPVPVTIGAIYEDSTFLGGASLNEETVAEAGQPPALAFIFAALADGADSDQTRQSIEAITDPLINLQVQDQTQFKDSFQAQINQVLSLVLALLALAIVIALFGIANTLALSVFERTREIGLLRAIGMTRRQTRAMIRWESITLSLLGTFMGLVLGTAFSSALITALKDEGIDVLSIPWDQLAIIAVVAVCAGFLTALLPARRAAKLDVLKAISTT